MKNIDHEILAIKRMIRLLNQCLAINIKTSDLEAIKSCLKDIQMCKDELEKAESIKRLLVAKKTLTEADKGAFRK